MDVSLLEQEVNLEGQWTGLYKKRWSITSSTRNSTLHPLILLAYKKAIKEILGNVGIKDEERHTNVCGLTIIKFISFKKSYICCTD